MKRTCWICGVAANSREHKIKRSDLVRAFGNGPFKDAGGLLHCVEGQSPRQLQGPNSRHLKYEPVLCADCNNTRSQPWDKAYEAFISSVFQNERVTLASRVINLCEVYGGPEQAVQSGPNLYRYFVKAFGCALANAGCRTPPRLVSILSQDEFLTNLLVTFTVNKAVFALAPEHRQMLGVGGLVRMDSRSTGEMERYFFKLHVGWLVIGFHYDMEIPIESGIPWVCATPIINLGEI